MTDNVVSKDLISLSNICKQNTTRSNMCKKKSITRTNWLTLYLRVRFEEDLVRRDERARFLARFFGRAGVPFRFDSEADGRLSLRFGEQGCSSSLCADSAVFSGFACVFAQTTSNSGGLSEDDNSDVLMSLTSKISCSDFSSFWTCALNFRSDRYNAAFLCFSSKMTASFEVRVFFRQMMV